jgi:hypothetical protein
MWFIILELVWPGEIGQGGVALQCVCRIWSGSGYRVRVTGSYPQFIVDKALQVTLSTPAQERGEWSGRLQLHLVSLS